MQMRSISRKNVLNASENLSWSERVQVSGKHEQQPSVVVMTAKYRDIPLVC